MDREPAPRTSKEVSHAVNLLDRLYHCQFAHVLKPGAFEDFRDAVFSHAIGENGSRPVELVVQFFISETPEEFAEPGALHWFGIKYGLEVEGDNVNLQASAVLTPKDPNHDIALMPEFEHTPICVLQWNDIAWDAFNPDVPVHP